MARSLHLTTHKSPTVCYTNEMPPCYNYYNYRDGTSDSGDESSTYHQFLSFLTLCEQVPFYTVESLCMIHADIYAMLGLVLQSCLMYASFNIPSIVSYMLHSMFYQVIHPVLHMPPTQFFIRGLSSASCATCPVLHMVPCACSIQCFTWESVHVLFSALCVTYQCIVSNWVSSGS